MAPMSYGFVKNTSGGLFVARMVNGVSRDRLRAARYQMVGTTAARFGSSPAARSPAMLLGAEPLGALCRAQSVHDPP